MLDNETATVTMQTDPRVAAYVTQHCRGVGRFAGMAYILAERGRMPMRWFGDTGRPCFAPAEASQLSRFQ